MAKRGKVDELNRILHHEMEAVGVYETVLGVSGQADPGMWDLHKIATDHRQTVAALKREITSLGGSPEIYAGSLNFWPTVPPKGKDRRLVEDRHALSALHEGEALEIEECRKILSNSNLREEARDYLEHRLLPTLVGHVTLLNSFLKQASS